MSQDDLERIPRSEQSQPRPRLSSNTGALDKSTRVALVVFLLSAAAGIGAIVYSVL